jgi:hypothetical protein
LPTKPVDPISITFLPRRISVTSSRGLPVTDSRRVGSGSPRLASGHGGGLPPPYAISVSSGPLRPLLRLSVARHHITSQISTAGWSIEIARRPIVRRAIAIARRSSLRFSSHDRGHGRVIRTDDDHPAHLLAAALAPYHM